MGMMGFITTDVTDLHGWGGRMGRERGGCMSFRVGVLESTHLGGGEHSLLWRS